MFFSQYEYFLKIAEEKSISKAAEKLNISQPGISKYVRRLEERLGMELIDHRSTPLALTAIGEIYLRYALEISAVEQRFREELSARLHANRKNVLIGISQWRSAFILPRLLPLLKQRFPLLEPVVKIEKTRTIIEELNKGTIDFCIINLYSLHQPDELLWKKIAEERIFLALNKNSEIALNAAQENPNLVFDLKRNQFPRLKLEHIKTRTLSLARYNSRISEAAAVLFGRANIAPHSEFLVNSLVTALYSVASNPVNIAFVPESGVYSNFIPENVILFTIGKPAFTSPIIVASPRKGPSSPGSAKLSLELFRDIEIC